MQNENLTTKLGKKAFILSVLLSYLENFTACFFVKFKKQISITQEVNLKIKEFNYVKAGLRAIHSENVPTCSFRGDAPVKFTWLALPWVNEYFPVLSDFSGLVDFHKQYHSQWNSDDRKSGNLLHVNGYYFNKNNEGTLCRTMIFFCFWMRVVCQCVSVEIFSSLMQKLADAGNLPRG